MEIRYTLGLDVAKLTVEACLLDPDSKAHRKEILNSPSGFQDLLSWLHGLNPKEVHACLEPTGKYSPAIATFLLDRGFLVSQVNSFTVLSHGRTKRIRGKSDKIDAFLLADYCLKERPPAWAPAETAQSELRDAESRIEALTEMIQQEKNRLEAGVSNTAVREEIQSHIVDLEQRRKRLEQLAVDIMNGDRVLKQNYSLLVSIIGIGERSALRLLAYVQFAKFKDSRTVGCFAGLTPQKYQSGTSIHRRESISRVGSTELRKFMYFPAMVAMQHNPQIRKFAERLSARGKPPKVVICAVMRKLLVLAATLVRNQEFYDVTRGVSLP
jgi:transposase